MVGLCSLEAKSFGPLQAKIALSVSVSAFSIRSSPVHGVLAETVVMLGLAMTLTVVEVLLVQLLLSVTVTL